MQMTREQWFRWTAFVASELGKAEAWRTIEKVGNRQLADYLREHPGVAQTIKDHGLDKDPGRLGNELNAARVGYLGQLVAVNRAARGETDKLYEHVRYEALASSTEEIREKAERMTGDARAEFLRDAAEHQAANELYWRTGRVPAPGSSALSELRAAAIAIQADDGSVRANEHRGVRDPDGRFDLKEVVAALAAEYGVAPADVSRFVAKAEGAERVARLVARRGEQDRETAAKFDRSTLSDRDRRRIAVEENRRSALEQAADRPGEPVPKWAKQPTTKPAAPTKVEPVKLSRRERLQEIADAQAAGRPIPEERVQRERTRHSDLADLADGKELPEAEEPRYDDGSRLATLRDAADAIGMEIA